MNFLLSLVLPEPGNLPELVRGWRDDAMTFLRHGLPKVVLVIVVAIVLARVLRFVIGKIASVQTRRLPSGLRAKQVKTLASVITSIEIFIIVFVAALEILPLFGFESDRCCERRSSGAGHRFWRANAGQRLHQRIFYFA